MPPPPSSSINISSIPTELLLEILSHTGGLSATSKLSRTNRHFHALLNDHLYNTAPLTSDLKSKALNAFVSSGRINRLHNLLDRGAPKNLKHVMETACHYDQRGALELLLPLAPNPSLAEDLMDLAAVLASIGCVLALLESGVKVRPSHLVHACGSVVVLGIWRPEEEMKAMNERKAEIARLLVRYGADVNAPHGASIPLHVAAGSVGGGELVVEALLDLGADIESMDSDKETALFRAAEQMDGRVVKLLLGRGADKTAMSKTGQFAKDLGWIALRKRGGMNPEALEALDYKGPW